MSTYPAQIEARARELHQTRKANTALRSQFIADLMTFDGGERDFCLSEAAREIEEEEYQAARQAHIDAQLAALTDDQLVANIACCTFEVEGNYPRHVTEGYRAERDLYQGEQRRRLRVKIKADDAASAVLVARLSELHADTAAMGNVPATQEQAA